MLQCPASVLGFKGHPCRKCAHPSEWPVAVRLIDFLLREAQVTSARAPLEELGWLELDGHWTCKFYLRKTVRFGDRQVVARRGKFTTYVVTGRGRHQALLEED